jgi:hypothetical protein
MNHLSVAVAAATILLATTACGGSPDPAAATDQLSDGLSEGGDSGRRELSGGDFAGANGEIAAIAGKTLQVQSPIDGQVAVTYTDATTFTEQVAAAASDLEVGDCVMVEGEGEDELAATTVRITPKTEGSCTPGMRGGPGLTQGDGPKGLPSDMPTELGDRMMSMGAFGEVTAIDGDSFTVRATLPGQDEASSRQVTTTADTSWTDTQTATAAALKVGKCIAATGEKDEVGAITADTIAVSDKVDGECTAGAVRRFEGSRP